MDHQSKETAFPDLADGSTLADLLAVIRAYSRTDAPSLLGRMFRTARWPSRLAVPVSICATIALYMWRIDYGAEIAAVLFACSVGLFKRDAFRAYYTKRGVAAFLDTFGRRDQSFRFVLFCEALPREIAGDHARLERILRLLEQRQKVRQAGVVTRHPVVAGLVALFLMLLGVLIAKAADYSVSGTITATILVGMLILLALQMGAIWRTREYRDEEMYEFVLWLWAGAIERAAPESTRIDAST